MKHVKTFESFIDLEGAKSEIIKSIDSLYVKIKQKYPDWKVLKYEGKPTIGKLNDISITPGLTSPSYNGSMGHNNENHIYIEFPNIKNGKTYIKISAYADIEHDEVYFIYKPVGTGIFDILKRKKNYPFGDGSSGGNQETEKGILTELEEVEKWYNKKIN